MITHFTKFETNKKKEPKLFFSSQLFLNKGHQARKRVEKIFSGLKTAKKQPKLLKNAFNSVKIAS